MAPLLCLLASCSGLSIAAPGPGYGVAVGRDRGHAGHGRVDPPAEATPRPGSDRGLPYLSLPPSPHEASLAALTPYAGAPVLIDPETGALLLQKYYSPEVGGSLLFLFGRRWLTDEKFWNPLDEPYLAGIELSYDFRSMLPFEIEMGFLYAKEEGEDPPTMIQEKLKSYEPYLGIRKTWELEHYSVWPYVGAGLCYQYVEADLATTLGPKHMGDGALGAYAHTGFLVLIGTTLVAGIDLRAVLGQSLDLEKDGVSFSTDGDYLQAAFSAGFAW